MTLKPTLFQFLYECPYRLCVESQIIRQTVPNRGPSDREVSCLESKVRYSDSDEATGRSKPEMSANH